MGLLEDSPSSAAAAASTVPEPKETYTKDSSWVSIEPGSHFSLANLPFGIFSLSPDSAEYKLDPGPAAQARAGVAIGSSVLDLRAFTRQGGFGLLNEYLDPSEVDSLESAFLNSDTLNDFAELGRPCHRLVRRYLGHVFSAEGMPLPQAQKSSPDGPRKRILQDQPDMIKACMIPMEIVKMHLPMRIGDYTDFYAGYHHAVNVGSLFRGVDKALQPNYMHLPVGYHGRASSIVTSGHPVNRPSGQILGPAPTQSSPGTTKDDKDKDKAKEELPKPSGPTPILAPTRKLDFELELGAFVCKPRKMGSRPLKVEEASSEHIFGYVLLNDWSARDVQAWEYVPLGPFTSKNFATSISPWIVLADVLQPYSILPKERPELLSYLKADPGADRTMFDIQLSVSLETKAGSKKQITTTSSRHLVYSFAQMLAHHTVTGCNIQTGDLLGSGTISGPSDGPASGWGSLLEQTRNGTEPITLSTDSDGSATELRTFLQNGDTVTLTGVCRPSGDSRLDEGENAYSLVGFGECSGMILPAVEQ